GGDASSDSGSDPGSDSGSDPGGDGDFALGGSDDGDGGGVDILPPDPEEPRLACVDAEGGLIAICDDDDGLFVACDSIFAAACEEQGGTLDDPTGHEIDIVPCSATEHYFHRCNDDFTNNCTAGGGSFECYWK